MSFELFQKLIEKCKVEFEKRKKEFSFFTLEQALFLLLVRLKENWNSKKLSKKFKPLKISTIGMIVRKMLLLFNSAVNTISLKNGKVVVYTNRKGEIELHGAVDCSILLHCKQHPGSGCLYRFDKKTHFLLVLVVTDLLGTSILHLSIFKGHLNDKMAWKRSMLGKKLMKENKFLLCDNGFSDSHLISIRDEEFISQWGLGLQPSLRSVIENIFAHSSLKCEFFKHRNYESTQIHVLGIKTIYEILNISLEQNPLRKSWLEILKTNQE